jgi:hypothetical protein
MLRIAPTEATDRRGVLVVNRHGYPITLRLWITYTPAGGGSRTIGIYGLHLGVTGTPYQSPSAAERASNSAASASRRRRLVGS